jgi:hypothetical protein
MMPEEEGEYLVTVKKYAFDSSYYDVQIAYCSPNKKWFRISNCEIVAWMPRPKPWSGEYNAVLNAVNVIKNFLDKYGADAGSSYWKSNIDDEMLVTDWGYVEEGLELLKGYCLELTKGAGDEA